MTKSMLAAIYLLSCFLLPNTVFAQGPGSAVSASVSSKAANRTLAKSVRRALGRVKGLDPTRVYVRANGGEITLSGSVRNQMQIDLAESTAKSVVGVSSVSNKITIFNEGGD
ncbi:BON domain-containing protein [Caballeronia sordidicola]|uniref:BON domain-containing protein n=1 Tax=Caballeronia sordidicola TaxID=196367 RepID=UPI0005561D10|nr:BON domain-containing protein [Caballeronia sordidicola]